MALTATHRSITLSILEELGFSEPGRLIAADANEAVDAPENQDSSAAKANLHAMAGYEAGIMQEAERAQVAVEALLRAAHDGVVQSCRAGRYETALRVLGAALHTVQDRAYHAFEPWPFASVVDAFLNFRRGLGHGLRPDYMLCHAVRDLSYISGLGYGARYASDTGWTGSARLEATLPSRSSWFPHLSGGVVYQQGITGTGTDVAGYVLLSWGAVPGSLPSRPFSSERPRGIPAFDRSLQICPEASHGPASLDRARRDSRDYVLAIRVDLEEGAWTRLTAYPRDPAAAGNR